MKTQNRLFLILIINLFAINSLLYAETPNKMSDWMLGGFVRPESFNPVIEPNPQSTFFCPMNEEQVKWEESDTFNPAAVVHKDKICVLYRAEDNSATGIGKRVSRVALAESEDGFTMTKHSAPVLYPADDNNKQYEWPGGCEDPRVAVTEDGLFVIFYTSWDRNKARLCIATSRDLLTWEKHGPAFASAYDGKYLDTWSKAASIVTEVKDDKLVISKVNGRYFMYWGEYRTHAAVSDDLCNWTPIEDENGKLLVLADTRNGYFDSDLVECGPPAVKTDKGILLMYNGKNKTNDDRDFRFNAGTYSAGQMLFDLNAPCKLLERTDVPFFRPMEDYEKSGQYRDGTVFIEGLVYYKSKWFLYYGCADSKVGVAVYDPANPQDGDFIPDYPTAKGIAGYPFKGLGKQVVSIHSSSGEANAGESAFNLLCNHIYTNKKWCENKNENPWVIFELNDYYNIDKLVFRDVAPYESGNGNVPEYWVYISTTGTDDDDWTLVKYANDGATVDVKEIDLDGSVEARYIKFVASRGTRTDNGQKENAIRIYGFDIYGEYSRPVERENLVSVGKSVMYFYKSNNYYQYPLHLLDGNKSNPANKWCFDKPSTSDPVRILILDLEEEYDIEKFVLYDAGFLGDKADNMTGCKIHISTEAPDLNLISTYQDNNKCWEKVVDDSEGKDDSVKTYTLDTPKRGRYLKLEIPRGRVGDLTSIYQFEVYKKAGGSSISNQSIDSIEIYPNILQSGDSLHIESLSGGEMSIYDLKGLKLFSDEVKTSSYSKQINLPSGNYIVKVRTQYKEETVKLIIL